MSDSNFNPAVPIDADPGIVEQLAPSLIIGRNTDGPVYDPALTTARAVFSGLSESATLLSDAQQAIKAARLTDPGTVDRMNAAAGRHMAKAQRLIADGLAAIDARTDQIQAAIDNEHLGINTTRLDVNENARAGEVRQFLRSLSRGERLETIRKAITIDKDRAVAAAVLSASPWAIGLEAREVAGIRMDAERVFAADAVRLREAIGRVRGRLEAAGAAVVKRYGGMVGVGDTAAAKAARSLAALEGGAQ